MKILFICGCLEPGHNGVGDYCVNLANELIINGHDCLCVSINDNYVSPDYLGVQCFISPLYPSVTCLRFSSKTTWLCRKQKLSAVISFFQPDWISFQYVPYSFHPKGLPFFLARWLHSFSTSASWHLMAHELWVEPFEKFPNVVLSNLQRLIFCQINTAINPKCIHTSNSAYKVRINKLGISASVLKIFPNIPISPLPASSGNHRSKSWVFAFFGSVHKEWKYKHFFERLSQACLIHGISRCRFLIIGNSGSFIERIILEYQASNCLECEFRILGYLTSSDIAKCLQDVDFGITTTPSHLIGKSGSVSAMLSYGLPVIVPRVRMPFDAWVDTYAARNQFILLDSKFEERMGYSYKFPASNPLSETALQLINSLSKSL